MHLRLFIFTLFCLSFSTHAFAQHKSGLRLGTNLSWYNQTVDTQTILPGDAFPDGRVKTDTKQYTPNMGFQVGYLWRIGVSKKISISIEAMLGVYSMDVKHNTSFGNYSGSAEADPSILYGPSVPICINYSIAKNWFISAGYEAMCNIYYGSTLVHLVTYGGGLHTKLGDFTLRMTQSLTTTETVYMGMSSSDDMVNMVDDRYLNSVQLTYTLPIKSAYRKLKEQDGK